MFGPDSININKIELEGKCPTQGLALCFDIDAVYGAIAFPSPKIEGDRIFVLIEEFVVGIQHIALTALQTLRGYMRHWLVASMSWASCVQPVDLLSAFGSEDGTVINFPNFQIRSGFWDMLSLQQPLVAETTVRPTLFPNKVTITVALHRRFPGPRVAEEVRRITTDSTPSIIGVVDWYTGTYIRVPAVETMSAIMDEDGELSGIADKELTGRVIGSVAGFAAHPDTVLFVGVDNMNSAFWATRGKTRSKFARLLLIPFLMWCVKRGVEVVVFYIRTNHNITADAIARLGESDPATWETKKQLTRGSLPNQWGAFCQFIPHLDWGRIRTERRTFRLTENIISSTHGKVAEWNASSYTATGMLEGLGVKTQPADFRFGQVMTQFRRWMICGAALQRPLIFLGTAHTGQVVRSFHHKLKR